MNLDEFNRFLSRIPDSIVNDTADIIVRLLNISKSRSSAKDFQVVKEGDMARHVRTFLLCGG